VIAFHGRTNDNAQVRAYYGLERSLEQQALVAYPSARRQADGTFSWTVTRSGLPSEPDLAVFDTLLQELGRRYCIDLQRVYLVGHSLGASFANTVACARSAQVRAVASLGGGIWIRDCDAPVAAMVMHNPNDRLVSVEHGRSARDVFLEASRLLGARQTDVAQSALNCRRYGDVREPNPVLWCPHQKDHKANGKYYPHNWPAAAAKEIERFLSSLP
jgi:polyhydroxybutyrate depolymerase